MTGKRDAMSLRANPDWRLVATWSRTNGWFIIELIHMDLGTVRTSLGGNP